MSHDMRDDRLGDMREAGVNKVEMRADPLLTIDCGNTRTKWGVFDAAGELKAHGVSATDALPTLQPSRAWASCQRAVISNVAGAEARVALDRLLGGMTVSYIQPGLQACGVENCYRQPAQLGADRWAAVVAAWHRYHADCVVVSAGTAVTIDALASDAATGEGVFLGGLILPGLQLMQQRIADKAPSVMLGEGALKDFPDNTADALYSGGLHAIAGAVRGLAERLAKRMAVHANALPRIVIAGGDAEALYALLAQEAPLANRLAIADNLVLQGLLILESEMR